LSAASSNEDASGECQPIELALCGLAANERPVPVSAKAILPGDLEAEVQTRRSRRSPRPSEGACWTLAFRDWQEGRPDETARRGDPRERESRGRHDCPTGCSDGLRASNWIACGDS